MRLTPELIDFFGLLGKISLKASNSSGVLWLFHSTNSGASYQFEFGFSCEIQVGGSLSASWAATLESARAALNESSSEDGLACRCFGAGAPNTSGQFLSGLPLSSPICPNLFDTRAGTQLFNE